MNLKQPDKFPRIINTEIINKKKIIFKMIK